MLYCKKNVLRDVCIMSVYCDLCVCKLRVFKCKGIVACAGFCGVTLSDRYENQTADPAYATVSFRESRRARVDDMMSLSSSQASFAIRTFVRRYMK